MSTKEDKFTFTKDESDPLKEKYGILPLIQSEKDPESRKNKFDLIENLDLSFEGKEVNVRARLQRSRIKGKGGFVVLRDRLNTIQGCLFLDDKTISQQMIKFVSSLRLESLIDIKAIVKKAEKAVESCSKKDIELTILEVFLVVSAPNVLPFQMEDVSRKVNPELEEGNYENDEEKFEDEKEKNKEKNKKTRKRFY